MTAGEFSARRPIECIPTVEVVTMADELRMSENGKVALWYMKPETFRDLGMGASFCKEMGIPLPDPANLGKTHCLIGHFDGATCPDDFFAATNNPYAPEIPGFQEAVSKSGAHHTSMSIGDIVVMDGHAMMCDVCGWHKLEG